EDRAAELAIVLHPVLRHRRPLLAVGDETVSLLALVGQLYCVSDELLHRRWRLEAGSFVEVFAIRKHIRVAGERERDLFALVAAERGHERGVDIIDLDLRRVALDPIRE